MLLSLKLRSDLMIEYIDNFFVDFFDLMDELRRKVDLVLDYGSTALSKRIVAQTVD